MQRGDEDRALGKLKGTVLEQLGEHAAMPSRSQIRRNSKGPPMRLAATDNDPSASASSVLMSNTWSVTLAPDERELRPRENVRTYGMLYR